VLTACNVEVDAAVNCYGGFVTRDVPPESGMWMTSIIDQVPGQRAPMLGLFGNDDVSPSPEDVNDLEKVLVENGKSYEFHRYDGAAHAFFCVDRPAYRPEAAVDGWERIETFFGRYL
jgi:carboxymethylenebutenolidase